MFTLNENGQLVVEVTRPNGMAYKFEFEPKTEFISDSGSVKGTSNKAQVTYFSFILKFPFRFLQIH